MKKIFAFIFLALFLIMPFSVMAEEGLEFTPQIGIGDSEFQQGVGVNLGSQYESSTGAIYLRSDLMARYIQAFYKYSQTVVGILAVIILMVGGLIWLTSAGEADKISQAKKMIGGSITGIIILFSSWIILNTINPDLVNLQTLEIVLIPEGKTTKSCCKYAGDIVKNNVEEKECIQGGGTYYENRQALYDGDSKTTGACIMTHSCCQYPDLRVKQDISKNECTSSGGTYYENSTASYIQDSTTKGACIKSTNQ